MTRDRVDVHAHFVPDTYRDFLETSGQSQPDGIKAIPPWSEAAALASMGEMEIARAYLSISSPGVYFGDQARTTAISRETNEEAARLRERNPGRFGFFATVPLPDVDAAEKELKYSLDELGANGVVLMTNTDGIYLGDERLEPLYAELDRRGSVLFVHPTTPHNGAHLALGYPRPMLEFFFETTRSISNLILSGTLVKYPNMRVVVPHAGAALPILANRIELLLPLLSLSGGSDIPSVKDALRGLHFDLAGAPIPELLQALLSVADQNNLHYGSDFPFTPHEAGLRLARQLDSTPFLSPEVAAALNVTNSEKLFTRR